MFNFKSPEPTWNTGNLCVPVTANGSETCTYSGSSGHHFGPDSAAIQGCGCQTSTPLTYNFTYGGAPHLNYYVNISNLNNQAVYLNFRGHNITVTISVTGCQGGTLNVTVKSQTTTNLKISSSSMKVLMYLYSDNDTYNAWLSGSHVSVSTYIVSAIPLEQLCPGGNFTSTDSVWTDITGYQDFQKVIFVNGAGYNTATNTIWGGHWNGVSFQNTTTFTCSWMYAPASTCHHGYTPIELQAASRKD
jgi:hypothetical protein